MQVKQLDVIYQGLEAMRKPLGNQQAAVVIGSKDFSVPLKKCWRVLPQIHRDVKHLSSQTTHKFVF